jgi:hypothetical protein
MLKQQLNFDKKKITVLKLTRAFSKGKISQVIADLDSICLLLEKQSKVLIYIYVAAPWQTLATPSGDQVVNVLAKQKINMTQRSLILTRR